MADVHPYPLASFDGEVQAEHDLERLREEIRVATAERDRIREEARQEGLDQARREAAASAGEAARAQIAADLEALSALVRNAVSEFVQKEGEYRAAVEGDLVRLAVGIAGRIVRAEVVRGRPVALESLRRAVELTSRRHELRILVNPQDLGLLDAYLPDLRRDFSEIREIALEASAAVERGGVLVRTEAGAADATLGTQLEEIERGLLE